MAAASTMFDNESSSLFSTIHDDESPPPPLYTDAQNRSLSLLSNLTAPLSLVGSLLIAYVIVTDRLYRKSSYHRIMLGLSMCDVLSSLGLSVFGAWSIPRSVTFVVGARVATNVPCDIAGFLLHWSLGSMLYTAALMIYFLLLIRREWRPETIAKRVEPVMHVVALTVTIASGLYAVTAGYMNPLERGPGLCWISSYPPACEEKDDIPCERGEGAEAFERLVLGTSTFGTFVIVVISMLLLYSKVRALETRLARYLPAGQAASHAKSRRTAWRGLAFIGAFFIAWIPVTIYLFVPRDASRAVQFIFSGLVNLFMPLQGFFNALIYLFPQREELNQSGHALSRLRSNLHSGLRSSVVRFSRAQRSSSTIVVVSTTTPQHHNGGSTSKEDSMTPVSEHMALSHQQHAPKQEDPWLNEQNNNDDVEQPPPQQLTTISSSGGPNEWNNEHDDIMEATPPTLLPQPVDANSSSDLSLHQQESNSIIGKNDQKVAILPPPQNQDSNQTRQLQKVVLLELTPNEGGP